MKQKAGTPLILIAALIGLFVALQPVAGFGYVLPAPYVIEKMTVGMGLPQQFQVRQVIYIKSKKNAHTETVDAYHYSQVLQYRLPGLFRSDIIGDDISHSYISGPDGSVTVLDGIMISESEQWFYGYKDLFSYRSRATLTNNLESKGVDVLVSSLGRLDKRLCYVIGARYPDLTVPQVWVDKETFMPVRYILAGAGKNEKNPAAEIRFSRWKQFSQMHYPTEIAFIENGIEVQTISVQKIDFNPVFEASLFDIQALKTIEKKQDEKENPLDFSDEIQKEIEEFRRIFEY